MEKITQESRAYKVFSIVRTIFVYLLALIIIVGAALFAADKSPSKSFFGYRYYTVLTPSMLPAFDSGDMVFVKVMSADQIEIGDVITFNPSSDGAAYLTHRVVEKYPNYQGTGVTCFRTKGDNNDTKDSFLIDEERVIGKVQFSIPKLGTVIRFIQLRWYFVLPLFALIFVFFALMKKYFVLRGETGEQEEKNSTNEQPPAETVKKEDQQTSSFHNANQEVITNGSQEEQT